MKEKIKEWGETLEKMMAQERGETRFKNCRRSGEYINVIGHDSSILEIVLNRGVKPYCSNAYTRVMWSAHHPAAKPYLYKHYHCLDFTDKPKQAFYDDKNFDEKDLEHDYLTEAEVGMLLFTSLIHDKQAAQQ